jgi:tetratricopeptide (TPR) repeat protein
VIAYGFSSYTPDADVAVDTLRLVVAGAGANFLRVSGDRVVPGMSGSMVLDEESGQVGGVVKASRNIDEVQGGWIIPITAVAEAFPDIAMRSSQVHRPGTQWFDLARDREHLQTAIFGRSAAGRARTPAGLLVAAQASVPFVPRDELSALHNWCEQQDDPQGVVRLVYAPGGAGKTRLATQLCADMLTRGWLAGFLAGSAAGERRHFIVEALTAGFPVLVVIDYAQDRLALLQDLLTYLRDYIDETAPIRILLLARAHQPWWEALAGQLGGAGDWALYRAHTVELGPLTETVRAADLADHAFIAFNERLKYPPRDPPATLRAAARRHRSILAVHALALDAALTIGAGDTWESWHDPLVRICDHEVGIWRQRLGHFGGLDLAAEIVPEAVLLVPTLAPGQDHASTVELLGKVIDLFPAVARRLDPELVWAALRDLYSTGHEELAAIEPDRVGEVLVRRLFRALVIGLPGSYLATLLAGNVRPGLHVLARARGCTVTGRIADDSAYPALDEAMKYLVRSKPAALIPAMVEIGAVLPHAEPIADVLTGVLAECDADILAEVEPRLPRHPTGLSQFATHVYQRMLAEHGDGNDDAGRLRRVHLLTQLSFRLSEAGRPAEGMEKAEEATIICADLARLSDDYRAEYAATLNNLSLRLAEGNGEDALGRSMEAEESYRALVADSPLDYRLDLAATLSNLALRLSEAERPTAAVEAAQEAVGLLEASMPRPRQEVLLAQALVNLSLVLMEVGAKRRAVDTAHRAVDLYRDLAGRQPGRHLLDLLDALQVLAAELSIDDKVGSLRAAYVAMSEAARLRQSFIGERTSLRYKQRQALDLLRQWSARIPEFETEGAEWTRRLGSI